MMPIPEHPDTPQPANSFELSASIERICLSCGLCCIGALHKVAFIEEEEQVRLQSFGLTVLNSPQYSRPAIPLPCAAHDGCKCTVYAHRPSVCSGYQCKLIKEVHSGLLDPHTAHQVTRQARSLWDSLVMSVDEDQRMAPWEGLKSILTSPVPTDPDALRSFQILALQTKGMEQMLPRFVDPSNMRDLETSNASGSVAA